MINQFYEALLAQLQTKVPGIKFIDFWNNQFDMLNTEDEIPFNFPAVFIEIDPIEWQTLADSSQQSPAVIIMHLGVETLQETSNQELLATRAAGMNHLPLVQDISKALHGFSGTNFGTITRIGTTFDQNYGSVKEILIPFKCLLTDNSLSINFNVIPKPPVVVEVL